MTLAEKRIGLIAGSGPFPILFAKKAAARGYEVFAAAYHHETDPALAGYVAAMEVLHLGQVGRLTRFFRKHGVQSAVMVGAIQKPRAVSEIRPDIKALSLLAAVRKDTHDDRLLRAFARFLEKEGIIVRPSTFLLPELLARPGSWTRKKPSKKERSDIILGWQKAKAIGALDIGQCVVVENGSVLAVEAIDGTDATIQRGGGLGRGNAVVVKVCKPIQDFRFDVPAVGAQTIGIMHGCGARVLIVEAGRSVVFDREKMVELADQYGISIEALADGQEQSQKNKAEQ
ncbi:MAG: UDP-2,3-diacylglucosamine diphosphatase LpxI [Desulfobacteraceae bacterium]|nr:UDP-2,3-diacylglucosamine diphosphatase LpxI [Desulfobacteraceae bacterium]